MRRIAAVALGLLLLSSGVTPGVAGAGTKWGKGLKLTDCENNTAFFPIPADQAQALVPEGFTAEGSPGSVEQVVNFYVSSLRCGTAGEQELEMMTTYVSVDPGGYGVPQTSFYIVDAGVEGTLARVLRNRLCLKDQLRTGSIEVTNQRAGWPLGERPQAGASVSSMDSDFLSVRTVVAAEGADGPARALQRWYFGDGSTFVDTVHDLDVWGLGSSSVAFTEPYRGLPPSSNGFSSMFIGDITLAGGCKKL